MSFLTEVSADRHFRSRARAVAGGGIDGARLRRFAASAIRQAWEIGAAVALIAAVMTALAGFELWVWFPHLPR